MKTGTVIWAIDGCDERGGSVYLRRLVDWRMRKGRRDLIIERRNRVNFLGWGLRIVLRVWLNCGEVRGTAPLVIPFALIAPRARLYVQSPAIKWSFLSRVLFRIAVARRGISAVCVSRYIAETVESYTAKGVKVCYAKITDKLQQWTEEETSDHVWIALMDGGILEKGYLNHLAVLTSVRDLNLNICIYAEVNDDDYLRRYDQLGRVRFCGKIQNPFEHFNEIKQGAKGFYLGMSSYEGLHMAVVEAGLTNVPTLMSDIPAHRELERISGTRLEIFRTTYKAAERLRAAISNSDLYRVMVGSSRMLGEKFQEVSLEREFIKT